MDTKLKGFTVYDWNFVVFYFIKVACVIINLELTNWKTNTLPHPI